MTDALTDAQALVTALQIGDSQFPAGGFAFSWGLESLWREGRIDRDHMGAFLEAQLRGRWASFDRAIVAAAHGADIDGWLALDDEVDAMNWSAQQRDGSSRAGQAMLAAHARLGTANAIAYRQRQPLAHLPVAQGLVYAGVGLDRVTAITLSGVNFLGSLASAAVRLGIVGAISVQSDLARLRPILAALTTEDPPQQPTSFAPAVDIAMCRHASGGALFSN